MLIMVNGLVRHAGPAAGLMERFGAVSSLAGLSYWSVRDHRFQALIMYAHAVEERGGDRKRPDYAVSEMRPGQALFFVEQDNRSSSQVVYKMTVRELSDDRLVVEMENTSAAHMWFLTMYGAGDLHSTYILERIADDLWSYYSLTGVHENALVRLQGEDREKSYVNRALALFSFITVIPRDSSLPWAR